MAKLPEQFIHQVQQAIDIVDLVGQSVALKKTGKDYSGLCPFHQEKTPSFNVSPTKQIFKCFGCGAGGSVFQFIMLQQKCNFPEAVRALAERANIRMPTDNLPAGEAEMGRGELTKLTAFAADFFKKQLRSPIGKGALEYAHGRKLTDESLDRFSIGYAPESWDALYKAARSANFSEKQLVAAGLVVPREQEGGAGRSGGYDRFRNRLMFPIIDVSGRVIAFGGRALAKEERAKYINSPETALFDKSSNLYGLSWARQPISDSGQAVIVEGYFDAVMPAQAGVLNVVATLGTALTDRHVRLLSRLARDVVLVFDSDSAGAAAAERGLELFIEQQINVRVAAVPEGKDPCDFVVAAGGEAFAALVKAAPDALEYLWQKRSAEFFASDNLVDQRRAVEEFLRVVVNSSAYGAIDPMRQGLLVNRLAQLLRLPPEQLSVQMRQLTRRVPTASGARPPVRSGVEQPAFSMGLSRVYRQILEILIVAPDHFEYVARHVGLEDFSDPSLAHLAAEVWRLASDGELSMESLLAVPNDDPEWGGLVTELALSAEGRGDYEATLQGALELVEHHRGQQELYGLRRSGDDDSLRQLSERLKKPNLRRRPTVT